MEINLTALCGKRRQSRSTKRLTGNGKGESEEEGKERERGGEGGVEKVEGA